MSHILDPAWLLLIPFITIVAFSVWALWNFSGELRVGRRRRARHPVYGFQVRIYSPQPPVLRFRRRHDNQAA
jgi:hypothetical protein